MASSSSKAASKKDAAVKAEALFKAAEAGNINEVTRLGQEGRYQLCHAEVVKFLISRKATLNLAEPCNGRTALHGAAISGNFLMIIAWLPDTEGFTPLILSAREGHLAVIKLLVIKGTDMLKD